MQQIKFIGSFKRTEECPKQDVPEFAFIGRSNVGKSSLINMLTGRRALAKVSSTPGKTQSLNFFEIDGSWHLVDLPGYGFAKVSKQERGKWEKMLHYYFGNREQLACVFALIDVRIPPQEKDLDFLNLLGEMMVPFVIVFTKADKINQREIAENTTAFFEKMGASWSELPQYFITSAEKGTGRDQVIDFINEVKFNLIHQKNGNP